MILLREYALQFVGLPYRWGGDDPMGGFDCSGLCIELLQSCGMYPHGSDTTAQGLYNYFKEGATLDKREFGSLVFFGKGADGRITHIGFMLDDKYMLEAGGGGSKTTSEEAAEKHNAYIRVRPIKIRRDLVAILGLNYSKNG